MKKLGNILLLLLTFAFVGVLVGYGVGNNFDYSTLLDMLVTDTNSFVLGTLNHLLSFINPLTLGLRLYVYAGLAVLGLLMGLFILIRLLKQGRAFKAFIGFVSPLIVAALGIAFLSPNFYGTNEPFYAYLLAQLSGSQFVNLAFLGSLTILPVLFFGIVTLQGLFSKRSPRSNVIVKKVKKVVKVKDQSKLAVQPLAAPVAASSVTLPESVQPLPAPAQVTQADLQLTELVKLVLSEELNTVRQPSYGGYGASVDVNTVRRIVTEELAKFQTHFITRAEAQTMVAQELTELKQQLKLK
jgi:hypothetical protein